MKDFLIFGIQGSGKGTQGALLAAKYGFTIFEMGRKLRELADQDSVLGEETKVINKGEMVSDDTVFSIVKSFLLGLTQKDRCIFDGMPRTVHQYHRLKDVLKSHGRDYIGILIQLNRKKAVTRIVERRLCPQCKRIFSNILDQISNCPQCHVSLIQREDDKDKNAVKKRIDTYLKFTHPITSILRKEGALIEINGEQEILEVFYEIEEELEKKEELEKMN